MTSFTRFSKTVPSINLLQTNWVWLDVPLTVAKATVPLQVGSQVLLLKLLKPGPLFKVNENPRVVLTAKVEVSCTWKLLLLVSFCAKMYEVVLPRPLKRTPL